MQESKFITGFDGTRIAYRVYGHGSPTIVICNGLSCNQSWMQKIIEALSPDHRVVIWDYRGHIDSAIPADERMATIDACVQDLQGVLQATQTKKAVFIGFSMGVQVALEFYGRHPEAALGLIALDGTYEYTLRTFSYIGALLDMVVEPALRNAVRFLPRTSEFFWKLILTGPWAFPLTKLIIVNWDKASREQFDVYSPHIVNLNLRNFTLMAQSMNNHSAVSVLPRIKVPTLIVVGDQDTFTPVDVAQKMHELVPNSEFHIVPGGSHAGVIEFPDVFIGHIQQFLDKHFAAKAKKTGKKAAPLELRAVS
jgi:pimeloyl-ACP methyl ester carboxylesterase